MKIVWVYGSTTGESQTGTRDGHEEAVANVVGALRGGGGLCCQVERTAGGPGVGVGRGEHGVAAAVVERVVDDRGVAAGEYTVDPGEVEGPLLVEPADVGRG